MLYQPKWVDGKESGRSKRDCNSRYEAIASYLTGREGFTVLDVGAYLGYFGARLHEDFGAHTTAVDDYAGLTDAPGVTAINKRMTAGEIRKLGHFDVALLLSVLHHVPRWREMLKAVVDSADIVFIETSNPNEVLPKARMHGSAADIHEAVEATGAKILTYTKGFGEDYDRPLWVLDKG
ncbi:hypothetical protein PBI_TWEETY_103 [Mycobacterium phage Tweety]|uniref:Methyltransferase n=3 Tax=Cheoctovirus TaxID=1623281 RepID=A0A0K1Y7D8_9CAUD|nr:methyltransferase [Mycobacterium phage Tweety]YP_009016992.1 methyltransferase [Mycobacterium phage DeadP]YP_009212742.1 methyltransferase [Mycobacterium phage Dante]ABQ86172.1 hypothetical protein PBI_TWEETY_103 [Mycobacterium phage Tweety]AER47844.1 hypothetical protein DEADP_102 [Mycobacterium phage DeadP]AKY03011.1 hypothetical protein SEA_DANTE_100 [Mycobacterium phage Dante]